MNYYPSVYNTKKYYYNYTKTTTEQITMTKIINDITNENMNTIIVTITLTIDIIIAVTTHITIVIAITDWHTHILN